MSRPILGKSAAVREMLKLIERVSNSKTNVLIIGESGTGKELVARMIHDSGPLKGKPFVPVNCGAIPETLIESEMFGHKRGSFTGAIADRAGLFEAAHGGTLFLDEVGELPLSMQVKLLRATQERVFRKVGGTESVTVDVRIIAATNRDLEAAVAKGAFREDLYYRLNVLLIRTPPLRERAGDVRLLAESFLDKFTERQKKKGDGFAPEAIRALEAYPWPGNVRELENVVERAVTLANGHRITLDYLPTAIRENARGGALISPEEKPRGKNGGAGNEIRLPAPDFSKGPVDLEKIVARIEKEYLSSALRSADGDKKAAAELLGLTARTLRHKMSKLGIGSGGDG